MGSYIMSGLCYRLELGISGIKEDKLVDIKKEVLKWLMLRLMTAILITMSFNSFAVSGININNRGKYDF